MSARGSSPLPQPLAGVVMPRPMLRLDTIEFVGLNRAEPAPPSAPVRLPKLLPSPSSPAEDTSTSSRPGPRAHAHASASACTRKRTRTHGLAPGICVRAS